MPVCNVFRKIQPQAYLFTIYIKALKLRLTFVSRGFCQRRTRPGTVPAVSCLTGKCATEQAIQQVIYNHERTHFALKYHQNTFVQYVCTLWYKIVCTRSWRTRNIVRIRARVQNNTRRFSLIRNIASLHFARSLSMCSDTSSHTCTHGYTDNGNSFKIVEIISKTLSSCNRFLSF